MKTVWICLVILLVCSGVVYAQNETPGENKQPHTFSAFSAAGMDFGDTEIAIISYYVCGEQHFTRGRIYRDNTLDNDQGGAGLWNFFEFATNKSADFMYISTHGGSDTSMDVSLFPHPGGQATCDSIFNYYNGIFPAGTIIKGLATYGGQRRYYISVKQPFFTRYLMTPQAILWGSFCYSGYFSASGPAEARDYLCYNNTVTVGKCICDERYVLRRMDGWYGQDKRPLQSAFAGVNGSCAGTNLVRRGAGNTVLSPSVTEYEPTGIVCYRTPGHVTFDTNMDTDIDPKTVVKASGDGHLENQRWSGRNRIDYDVVPDRSNPNISYRVIESKAKGRADNARLDGNTNPAGLNAFGPNRDDFIWATTCPECPITTTTITPPPDTIYTPPPDTFTIIPPDSFIVPPTTISVPVTVINGHTDAIDVRITAHNEFIPITPAETTFVLDAGTSATVTFLHDIDISDLPDFPAESFFDVYVNLELFQSDTSVIVVTPYLRSGILSVENTYPGDNASATIWVQNTSDIPIEMVELELIGDWEYSVDPSYFSLEPGEHTTATITVPVPLSAPICSEDRCRVNLWAEFPTKPLELTFEVKPPVEFGVSDDTLEFYPGDSHWLHFSLTNVGEESQIFALQLEEGSGLFEYYPTTFACDIPPEGTFSDSVQIRATTEYTSSENTRLDFNSPCDSKVINIGSAELKLQPSAVIEGLNDTIAPVVEMEPFMVYQDFFVSNVSARAGTLNLRVDAPSDITVNVEPSTYVIEAGQEGYDAQLSVLVPSDIAVGRALDINVYLERERGGLVTAEDWKGIQVKAKSPVIWQAPQERGIGVAAGDSVEVELVLLNLTSVDAIVVTNFTDSLDWDVSTSLGSEPVMVPGNDSLTLTLTVISNPLSPLGATDKIQGIVSCSPDRMSALPVIPKADTIAYHVMVSEITTNVKENLSLPTSFGFKAAYPNPFNSAVNVTYQLEDDGWVELSCYNLLGEKVQQIFHTRQTAGRHEILWSPGMDVASGIYFLRLTQGARSEQTRVLYLK